MVYLSTDQRDVLVAGLDTFHCVQKSLSLDGEEKIKMKSVGDDECFRG